MRQQNPFRRAGILVITVISTTLFWSCLDGNIGDRYREPFEQRIAVAEGAVLTLENVNGWIEVNAWPDEGPREVLIEAEKMASSESGLERLEIEVRATGEGLTIRTKLPRSRWYSSGGRVEYRLTVPPDSHLSLQTVNGRVRVEGVRGDLKARSVNGSISLSDIQGRASARSVNGSVRGVFEEVMVDAGHYFTTTNGSVELSLPHEASGRVEARTVNGRIRTDFPLNVSGRWGPKRLEGRLGPGKGSLEVKTINGSIVIGKHS